MTHMRSLLPIAALPLINAQFNTTESSPTTSPTNSFVPTESASPSSTNTEVNITNIFEGNQTEINNTNIFESEITLSGSTQSAAATTISVTTTPQVLDTTPSTITGLSFFDSNNNGIKDTNLDYAISSIAVSLYTCDSSSINFGTSLQEATTDFSGMYKFEVDPGSYRIGVDNIPSWYTFSSSWAGAMDDAGNLMYPDSTSVIDPATGQSGCFDVEGGVTEDKKDFGMRLNIPSPPASTPNPTSGPTPAGTGVSSVVGTENASESPSNSPSSEAPTTPVPTVSVVTTPGGSPGGGIIVPSPPPSLPPVAPTASPSAGATIENTTAPVIPVSETPSIIPSMVPSGVPSVMNSDIPSAIPSILPSGVPSEIPSISPSNATTTSVPTTVSEAPTIPIVIGDSIGPVTSEDLKMTFTGINMLENDTAWAEETSTYIMNYFSEGYNVWDVEVSINVKAQSSGGRKLQEQSSVVVTYDQTTTYKTDDGTEPMVIATEPFASILDRRRYLIYLADTSTYYGDVSAVSGVSTSVSDSGSDGSDSSVDGATAPPQSPEESKNITPIIIGVCVAVGAVLLVGGLYLAYVRRDRGDDYYDDHVGNNNAFVSSGSAGSGRRGSQDLETGSRGSKRSVGSRQGSRQGSIRYGDDE